MTSACDRGEEASAGIYAGRVQHRRLRPRKHSLSYRVFYLLLDLDTLPDLARRLRFFSLGRFNLLSFRERDHGDGNGTLRPQIEAMARDSGVVGNLGTIRILTLPRILGHVFNPLTVFFCHSNAGELACIVYEVSNTFGERHSYVIPVAGQAEDGQVRQRCRKGFYVSPFLDMDLVYDFVVRPPGATVGVAVSASDEHGVVIATSLAGRRSELSDAAILSALLRHPLLTLKVVVAIHWEALWIWLKGISIRPRPAAPVRSFTAVPPLRSGEAMR